MAEPFCVRTLSPSALSSSGLLSLQSQSVRHDSINVGKKGGCSSRRRLLVSCETQIRKIDRKLPSGGNKLVTGKRMTTGPLNRKPESGGTRIIGGKRVKVLQEGDKSANFRDKAADQRGAVKLLSRVEQLRLLTKAEKAGLLSAAENVGLSLSAIEKLGLLSKAEGLGVLSAATDPSTPRSLLTLALAFLLAGPAFVYLVPEEATWQVLLQYAVALISVLGGSAAFAASNLVSSLQKSD